MANSSKSVLKSSLQPVPNTEKVLYDYTWQTLWLQEVLTELLNLCLNKVTFIIELY